MAVRSTTFVLAATLLLAACSAYRGGLSALKRETRGRFVPVRRADFPTGDPREGANGAPGSRMLAFAAQGHEAVAAAVRRYGIPDAIAIGGGSGLAVELAYLQPPVLRTIALVGYWRAEVSERPLSAAEIAQVDPELVLRAQAEVLRDRVAAMTRVQRVGSALLRTVPPDGASHAVFGVLFVNATPAAARLLGGDPAKAQQIVAWVDPAGPQRERLRPGDRITAVDGNPPVPGWRWNGPVRLTIQRAGATADVVIEPEAMPRAVAFVLIDDRRPNALAVQDGVAVTTGLLALTASDDALAAALGHELAHITLGHTKEKVTAAGVLKGIVGTVLLPAEVAAPGSSRLFTGLIQGVENRFNRDQERDADRLGLHYAKAAGYDPAAALGLFDALQAEVPADAVGEFFDVHPSYAERRTLIEEELRTLR